MHSQIDRIIVMNLNPEITRLIGESTDSLQAIVQIAKHNSEIIADGDKIMPHSYGAIRIKSKHVTCLN